MNGILLHMLQPKACATAAVKLLDSLCGDSGYRTVTANGAIDLLHVRECMLIDLLISIDITSGLPSSQDLYVASLCKMACGSLVFCYYCKI